MKLFPATMQSLEKSLDVYALRQKTISSNIANVDTPNYKSKNVSFEEEFSKYLQKRKYIQAHRTDSKHIPFRHQDSGDIQPRIQQNFHSMFNHNGNNVDMDIEMSKLAKNQIQYNAAIDKVSGQFRKLQSVINEGR